MSSKSKTPLGLSQWEGADTPERLDFNSDNLLTDWALQERVKKVKTPTPGNFPVLTGDGGIADSGKSAGDYEGELGKKADIVEVLYDVDCHTLKTPKDYIIINTDKTVAGNVALHYPPESGHWGLTIKATLAVDGSNGKLYMATNRDSGNVWKKLEVSGVWYEWKLLATATPPQEFNLPLAEGIVAYTPCKYRRNQEHEITVTLRCVFSNGLTSAQTLANLPEGFRPGSIVTATCNIVMASNSVVSGHIDVNINGSIMVHFYSTVTGNGAVITSPISFLAVT